MPMADFRCPAGHEFEAFLHSSETDTSVLGCRECGAPATRFYSYRKPHSYSGMQTGIVLHKKPDGTYSVPAHRDAPLPEGCERVELRTAAEVRSVEREMASEEYAKWERKQDIEQSFYSERDKTLRSELRRRMQSMSAAGRDFAEYAMRQNDQRERPRFRSNVFFEAFSQDSSNRDAHRDETTGWRPRK